MFYEGNLVLHMLKPAGSKDNLLSKNKLVLENSWNVVSGSRTPEMTRFG
jgi:hypothetical protein